VLADEPTANLDHKTGEEILLLMKRINRKFKTTFIFSTHDKRVIAKADRLVRVEDGEIALLGMRSHTKWSVARHRPSEAGASNHDTSSQASEMSAAGAGRTAMQIRINQRSACLVAGACERNRVSGGCLPIPRTALARPAIVVTQPFAVELVSLLAAKSADRPCRRAAMPCLATTIRQGIAAGRKSGAALRQRGTGQAADCGAAGQSGCAVR
jgi:energy-coupling factor transporter ATP-binding protein EcfA2